MKNLFFAAHYFNACFRAIKKQKQITTSASDIRKMCLQKLQEKIKMDGYMCILKAHLLILVTSMVIYWQMILILSIQAVAYYLQHETHRDWHFYRQAARNFLWDKLDREYKDEINGIVAGLHAQNKNYDSLDLTAYNALEELAFYYVPCWIMQNGGIKLRAIAVHLLQRAVIQKMEKLLLDIITGRSISLASTGM